MAFNGWLVRIPAWPDQYLLKNIKLQRQTVHVKAPVILTTSYDEFALKAFKVNSVDFLLKLVQTEDLQVALTQHKKLSAAKLGDVTIETLVKQIQQQLQPNEYRKRFLVKHAQKLVSVDVDEIGYFYSDGRLNFFKTADNKKICG